MDIKQTKPTRKTLTGKTGLLAALGGTVALLVLIAALLISGASGDADAKAKDKDKPAGKDHARTLSLLKVDSPASFKGMAPFPTKPASGQKLLAITIDFDRDFKNHLLSSESGEIYLTASNNARTIYHTVDTALPVSGGPGKKPVTQATFVFAVPQEASGLTFHYGALYSLPLS